jgi:nucleoside-diphosphate-sugar epimerase
MKVLITGGAGFIGCNWASRLMREGVYDVTVFDNLSRKGTQANLDWLKSQGELNFVYGDVRDAAALAEAAKDHQAIYHLASQVAVTTSVANPREDFEINALGTFNVLEAARLSGMNPLVVYASTNKVYGGMEDVRVSEEATRYRYTDLPLGLPESQPLDFHSPYGCCYSEDTDILTRRGWKKFYELAPPDEVLTYNLECNMAEYQRPTAHFAFPYHGKMYVQNNRRLKTCVTPNHKMLVAWDCTHDRLERPRLMEAQLIQGKPMVYLLAAEVEGGEECEQFILPAIKAGKHKHHFPARAIPMSDWLKFLGWYISEGHCYENKKTGNCTVTLTTYYRTEEAVAVMRAVGLSPVVDKHHITATSRQLFEYVKRLGKSREKYIPQCVKELNQKHLVVLLKSLLDGEGNAQSKNSWRYTTVSKCLADDVQEIAIKCGMAASVTLDKDGFYRVYIGTARTAHCNLGRDRSEWVDYAGMVYCVEVPNSVVMVRQNGYAYFSGNSKGAGDQYTRDYARIYGLPTVVFRQSCIYGTRQFGVEDQGWIAHFVIATAKGRPLNIYGDGKQVRDILWIDDLLDAYAIALKHPEKVAGRIFNLGGGPEFALSIWAEMQPLLEKLAGRKIETRRGEWRPGDQKVYVSDIRLAQEALGWRPKVSPQQGVGRLWEWVNANIALFE